MNSGSKPSPSNCRFQNDSGPSNLKVAKANRAVVDVQFDVIRRLVEGDVLVYAEVQVANKTDDLLQVVIRFEAKRDFSIPEDQPRTVSIVEFSKQQKVKIAKIGLFDGKWSKTDDGKKYIAKLWGWVMQNGNPSEFFYSKEFTYRRNSTV